MRIKTADLIGAALDWAVAKCEEFKLHSFGSFIRVWGSHPDCVPGAYGSNGAQHGVHFTPSTLWSQGGPIIEREQITVRPSDGMTSWAAVMQFRQGVDWIDGPTPLIAAMRCYVASKLGDEIDIPEELL